jgi:uncharacterized protein DUF6459
MRTRPQRGSRPPVRLIPYSATTPVGAGGGQAATGTRPLPPPPRPPVTGPPVTGPPVTGPPLSRPPLHAVPAAEGNPEDDLAAAVLATARAFAEVMAGVRPLHHLAGRATPEVYDRLGKTLPAARPAGRYASRTLRVSVPLVQVPRRGVAEVAAVVFTGGRAQALALRLERRRGRWWCAAVETTLSPRQLRDHRAHQPGTAA